jgi:hypothetical protein
MHRWVRAHRVRLKKMLESMHASFRREHSNVAQGVRSPGRHWSGGRPPYFGGLTRPLRMIQGRTHPRAAYSWAPSTNAAAPLGPWPRPPPSATIASGVVSRAKRLGCERSSGVTPRNHPDVLPGASGRRLEGLLRTSGRPGGVRSEHGACQTCYGGICNTDAHDSDRVLIWESLLSDTVPPDDNPPATSRRRGQTPVKAGGAAVSSPVRRS